MYSCYPLRFIIQFLIPIETRHHVHKVRSFELTTTGLCKSANLFGMSGDVYAKGKFFPPNAFVDIYVTNDKVWSPGDNLIGTDVSGSVETVATGPEGKICAKVWGNPLIIGNYDLVVDANQDGTFDPKDGDTVNKKVGRGFRMQ